MPPFPPQDDVVLKAILKKKVNESKDAMWVKTHIAQDVGQPHMVCLFPAQPMGDIFVTDVVALYVLIFCHINDGSRLPSFLLPWLESDVYISYYDMLERGVVEFVKDQRPDVSEIAVLYSRDDVPHCDVSSISLPFVCSSLVSQR